MNRRPILVTGSHPPDSNWVGTTISMADSIACIHEPFHLLTRRCILDVPLENWYIFVCSENEERYREAYADLISFHYKTGAELKYIKLGTCLQDLARMVRERGQVQAFQETLVCPSGQRSNRPLLR
jgi:hypothetical protein